jgi:hypothetical protein
MRVKIISHVNYRDLFHQEILVNHTYLYNKKTIILLIKTWNYLKAHLY